MLSFTTADTRQEADERRVRVEDLGMGFFRVVGNFGFMESPNVPRVQHHISASRRLTAIASTSYTRAASEKEVSLP